MHLREDALIQAPCRSSSWAPSSSPTTPMIVTRPPSDAIFAAVFAEHQPRRAPHAGWRLEAWEPALAQSPLSSCRTLPGCRATGGPTLRFGVVPVDTPGPLQQYRHTSVQGLLSRNHSRPNSRTDSARARAAYHQICPESGRCQPTAPLPADRPRCRPRGLHVRGDTGYSTSSGTAARRQTLPTTKFGGSFPRRPQTRARWHDTTRRTGACRRL